MNADNVLTLLHSETSNSILWTLVEQNQGTKIIASTLDFSLMIEFFQWQAGYLCVKPFENIARKHPTAPSILQHKNVEITSVFG